MTAEPDRAALGVYALVLAAGGGSRFGGDKLMTPLHGRPLAAYAATAVAEAIGGGVLAGGVAVVPPSDTALAWQFDPAGLQPVENPAAHTGLASSLRAGFAALEEPRLDPAPGAALVILADQPLVRPEVIAALVAEWRRSGSSARPRYRDTPDTPGHPVLVDRSLWRLAGRLNGDTGLAALLRGHPMVLLDVPGANPDVDTPEDLRQLEDIR